MSEPNVGTGRTRGDYRPSDAERMKLRMLFATLLRAERAHASFSQSALARAVGMTTRMVEMLEAGDRRPSASTIAVFAIALGARSGRNVENIGVNLAKAAGTSLRADTERGRARHLRNLERANRNEMLRRGILLREPIG